MSLSKFLALAFAFLFVQQVHAAVIEQTSDDVQILQAWVGRGIELSLKNCSGMNPVDRTPVVKDCTFQGLSMLRSQGRISPAAAPWILPDVIFFEGRLWSYLFAGNVVEIRALVKKSVLESPTFRGIGFYSRNYGFEGLHQISPRDLHVVSTSDVYLKNGEPAVVLRFVLYFPGWQGRSSTGWARDSVDFKPFAAFEVNGLKIRNWDAVRANYHLNRYENGGGRRQVTAINREFELLR